MHILLVADGRSPTTLRWLSGMIATGHAVTLISSFPCDPPPGIKAFHVIPIAFGWLAGSGSTSASANPGAHPAPAVKRLVGRFRSFFLSGRYLLGPLSLHLSPDILRFRSIIARTQPELVHALRIPFEGMLASFTPPGIPLVISIWGNDLTLHAHGSPWMATLTRRCLRRAQGLMADTTRDLNLARNWGFAPEKPVLSVPGSGGLDLEEIAGCQGTLPAYLQNMLPAGAPLVVNPRGFRPGSLRNDTFFKAIPLVLERLPETTFVCPSMAGQAEALAWVKALGIQNRVRLLPVLPQPVLWSLFFQSQVFVSPSVHDGTPNSLLEAIACGCFPVVGNIESFREWITSGVNGLLVDAADPQALAVAILKALDSPNLRIQATSINAGLVAERAGVRQVRARVAAFYQSI